MAFSKTTASVERREKTVTRRLGWGFLKAGDRLWAVEKCQGLKKGEKVKRIAIIEIVSIRWERLGDIFNYPRAGKFEVEKEGFAECSPREFLDRTFSGVPLFTPINRIEFRYPSALELSEQCLAKPKDGGGE